MVKVVDHEQHAEARLVRLLRVVRDHINEFGVGPTTADSAAMMRFRNVSAAQPLLERLEQKGLIERAPGNWRSTRITQAGDKVANRVEHCEREMAPMVSHLREIGASTAEIIAAVQSITRPPPRFVERAANDA